MSKKHPLGLNLCIVAAMAGMTMAPHSSVAKGKKTDRHTQHIKELEAENAQLRSEVAELRKARDQSQTGQSPPAIKDSEGDPGSAQNPFVMKELDKGYANGAKADQNKDGKEMSCGAKMMKGGEMQCGAKMMKAGEMRCGSNMMGDTMAAMEPGSQMQMNPVLAGSEFYHIHPKGMWMFNTKFMHVDMRGLGTGSRNVPVSQVIPDHNGLPRKSPPYNYMMAPTYMTMDMFMLMPMVGITDRLTVMAMANYMTMNMGMQMGHGNSTEVTSMAPMRTQGVSDTEFDAVYALSHEVFGTLGLTIPTGSIKQKVEMMGATFRAPYDMQNGTGTFSLKPALSYHHVTDDALWMWGGQATYTAQLGRNAQGYSRGNNIKVTAFLQRAFGPTTGFLRMNFNDTGRIDGEDSQIAKINFSSLDGGASMPDADPRNYGGQRLDAFIGAAYEKGPFSLGVEGGVPVYQYLNGLQLKTTWTLNAAFQAMF